MFQFHYGTIKSVLQRWMDRNNIAFQFHYGTIKSLTARIIRGLQRLFQFHYGTIKRPPPLIMTVEFARFNSTMVRLKGGTGDTITVRPWFQFHYGTIKRAAAGEVADSWFIVSIPLWYD